MTTRSLTFAEGEFYHLYNRGVDKRIIFNSDKDKRLFLERLYLANGSKRIDMRSLRKSESDLFEWDRGEQQIAIGAYCLMPNHFHLLVKQLVEGGITTFMNKLTTSYAMYFNKANNRTGALFEGRFKAQHVSSDEYLKYLFSYIHLNPVKLIQSDWKERGILRAEAAFEYATDYVGSSLKSYIEPTDSNAILSPANFPDYFVTAANHREELLSWLNFSNK